MIDFRGRVSDMYKYRYLLRRLFSHDYLNSPERQAQTVNNHVSFWRAKQPASLTYLQLLTVYFKYSSSNYSYLPRQTSH